MGEAQADVGHIAEIHKADGVLRADPGPDPAMNQPPAKERFIGGNGDGIVREGGKVPPAVFVQQQVVAFQQDDRAVYKQLKFHNPPNQQVFAISQLQI